jgi:hypothetical protein
MYLKTYYGNIGHKKDKNVDPKRFKLPHDTANNDLNTSPSRMYFRVIVTQDTIMDHGRSGGGGPTGQLPRAPTYKGRQNVTGIVGNMVLVNLSFPQAKEFL